MPLSLVSNVLQMMAVLLEAEMTNTPEPERERLFIQRGTYYYVSKAEMWRKQKQCQYKSGRGVEGLVWAGKRSARWQLWANVYCFQKHFEQKRCELQVPQSHCTSIPSREHRGTELTALGEDLLSMMAPMKDSTLIYTAAVNRLLVRMQFLNC